MIVRFPALLRSALPPRHIRPRPAVIVAEDEYQVPEFSCSGMPEVLVVTAPRPWSDDESRTFRFLDGGLYAQSAMRLEDYLEDLADPFRPGGAFSDIVSEIRQHIRTLDQRFKCWPDGIAYALANRKPSAAIDRILAAGRLVRPEDAEPFAGDIAYWRDLHRRERRLHAIHAGRLWRRVPEPVIRVTPDGNHARISVEYDDIFRTMEGANAPSPATGFHFPIRGIEEAVSFARALTPSGEVTGHERIVARLESPRYLVLDVYEEDLIKSAESLLARGSSWMPEERDTPLSRSMSVLKDAARGRATDPDSVASAMNGVLDEATAAVKAGKVARNDVGFEYHRAHIAKWHDRPIDLCHFQFAENPSP